MKSCRVLRGAVADVALHVDHLGQSQVHEALLVQQVPDHPHRLGAQTALTSQVILENKTGTVRSSRLFLGSALLFCE